MDQIQNSQGDIAAPLQPFTCVVTPQQIQSQNAYMLPVISNKSIPFVMTSEMKCILRQSFEERFNILAGVGHIHPSTSHPCSVCGEEGQWSEEEYWSHTTSIVCSNRVFKVEGK